MPRFLVHSDRHWIASMHQWHVAEIPGVFNDMDRPRGACHATPNFIPFSTIVFANDANKAFDHPVRDSYHCRMSYIAAFKEVDKSRPRPYQPIQWRNR